MDPKRFDSFARTLATRLPRRGLGPLAAALLALGLGEAGAKDGKNGKEAKGRDTSRNEPAKKRRNRRGAGDDRRASPKDNREDHGGGGAPTAAGKKKPKCVPEGGSCKKPKKGKSKKCCAGLSCDGATKQCAAVGGGENCPAEFKACNGGCLPVETPCCAGDTRPCDGSCASGDVCCQDEFQQCMAPVATDWYAAAEACSAVCADRQSAACRDCIAALLTEFADPFAACFRINCTARDGVSTAGRAGAIRPCDKRGLSRCRRDAMLANVASAGLEVPVGMLEGPLGVLAATLLNAGKLKVDLDLCETQFGCPTGECDPNHGVCCGGVGACEFYDPGSATCKGCPKDTYCKFSTGRCVTQCKRCDEYLVDGRQMPCGGIINNCGVFLTCDPCRDNQRCLNRRCVETCPTGSRRGGRAAGDECCMPKTCAELGVQCGPAQNGCGGFIDCGPCVVVGTLSIHLRTEWDNPDANPNHLPGAHYAHQALESYDVEYVARTDSVWQNGSFSSVYKTQNYCVDLQNNVESYTTTESRTFDYEGSARAFDRGGSGSGGFAPPDAQGWFELAVDPTLRVPQTTVQGLPARCEEPAYERTDTGGVHPDQGYANATLFLQIGAMSADSTWSGSSTQGSGITHYGSGESGTMTKTHTWAWNLQQVHA